MTNPANAVGTVCIFIAYQINAFDNMTHAHRAEYDDINLIHWKFLSIRSCHSGCCMTLVRPICIPTTSLIALVTIRIWLWYYQKQMRIQFYSVKNHLGNLVFYDLAQAPLESIDSTQIFALSTSDFFVVIKKTNPISEKAFEFNYIWFWFILCALEHLNE